MLGATKSWREKLKCSFFHSQGSQFRQTYPARGRLIAGEIEFENQFPPWIRNSRLVFKMMCRCSQIWQEKVWTDTRYFFVLFRSPSSVKHPAEDLNFWCVVPLFSKCQFTDQVSLFSAVRVQRSLNESYFWCVSINKRKLLLFCTLLMFIPFPFVHRCEQNKWADFRMTVDVKSSPQGILKRSKPERLIAMLRWKTW